MAHQQDEDEFEWKLGCKKFSPRHLSLVQLATKAPYAFTTPRTLDECEVDYTGDRWWRRV